MGILTEQKGQGMNSLMMGFMTAIMGFVMLGPMLEILNSVISTIVAGNRSAFSNTGSMDLMLGMTGILLIILVIFTVVNSFLTPPQQGVY